MKELTKETFAEAIQGEKVVVMFIKDGCSNCVAMKPKLQALSETHKNIQFYTFKVGKDVKPTDAFMQKFQFKMFPGIFTFSKGVLIHGLSGIVDEASILVAYDDLNSLKILAYDLNTELQKIQQIQQSFQIVNTIIQNRQNARHLDLQAPVDDWELSIPVVGEPEECESCQ
jgi:thioredoxin-like negative regulator of GroEL